MAHKAPKQHTIDSIRKGKPGGAPLYRTEYDGIASRLVKHTAATVSEIAETLGVSVGTIYNWQSKHPSFKDALKIPEEDANHRVKLSLYNQAVGYYYEDEEIKIVEGAVYRIKVKRWMPPNPGAAIYWTKARMGWSDAERLPETPSQDGEVIDAETHESMKQIARRIGFVLVQGGKKVG